MGCLEPRLVCSQVLENRMSQMMAETPTRLPQGLPEVTRQVLSEDCCHVATIPRLCCPSYPAATARSLGSGKKYVTVAVALSAVPAKPATKPDSNLSPDQAFAALRAAQSAFASNKDALKAEFEKIFKRAMGVKESQ